MSLVHALRLAAGAVAPPLEVPPSRWARDNIILIKGPRVGKPYRPDGYEYQTGILDQLFSPHRPGELDREGVAFKGARTGVTLCMQIGALYTNIHRRLSAAMVVPRKPDSAELATDFSNFLLKNRKLRKAYSRIKGRDKKTIDGAELICRSGETERDFVGWGAPLGIGDEVDRWGRLDFDQWAMLLERLGDHLERTAIKLSTPTFPDYGVDAAYKLSNRQRYFIPCQLCGHRQVLSFEDNIVWNDLATTEDAKIDSARFICSKCGKTWNRRHRQRANGAGEWVAEAPDVRRIGFAISRLYVPVATAQEFVKAKFAGERDVKKEREFFNQKLGLPYLAAIGNLSQGAVASLISSEVTWGIPPSGYRRLTAGVDVQGDEPPFEYWFEVRAFDAQNRAALIRYGKAVGGRALAEVLEDTYDGRRIERALIDISDGHHKKAVEELCRDIGCLEPARFDWRARVSFKKFSRERVDETAGISGWAVKRDDALDDNLSRFFERQGRPATLVIARNPVAAAEKSLYWHYNGLVRAREEGEDGPTYTYKKKRQTGVDLPFAGALAEVARQVGGSLLQGRGAGYGRRPKRLSTEETPAPLVRSKEKPKKKGAGGGYGVIKGGTRR